VYIKVSLNSCCYRLDKEVGFDYSYTRLHMSHKCSAFMSKLLPLALA